MAGPAERLSPDGLPERPVSPWRLLALLRALAFARALLTAEFVRRASASRAFWAFSAAAPGLVTLGSGVFFTGEGLAADVSR